MGGGRSCGLSPQRRVTSRRRGCSFVWEEDERRLDLWSFSLGVGYLLPVITSLYCFS
jgi:hypothetical protein